MSSKIIAVYLSIFALLGLLLYGFWTDPKHVPSQLLGKAAPNFKVTQLGTSEMLELQTLQGKPVLLNFWASWCVECQREAAILEQTYQQYERAQGQLKVIGIAIQDTEEQASRFAKHFGKNYFLALDDAQGNIAFDYGVYGAPETFLIDAQGVIRAKKVGSVTPQWIADELGKL